MTERAQERREQIQQLISTSGADDDIRIVLWQGFQASFEPLLRQAKVVPKHVDVIEPYKKLLAYLREKRDRYTVTPDGKILFNDGWDLADYRRRLSDIRFGL
jgi:hypothetical protein